jgi:hypothetical protein
VLDFIYKENICFYNTLDLQYVSNVCVRQFGVVRDMDVCHNSQHYFIYIVIDLLQKVASVVNLHELGTNSQQMT